MAAAVSAIADYGDLCGEGPLWNTGEQALYWTDLARQRLYRYRWPSAQSELVSERLQVSAFAFNDPGGLIVTNVRGIWSWDLRSEPVLLASEAEGRRCCLNDCIADSEGRVYSGSYLRIPDTGEFQSGAGSLFCVDNNGAVRVVDDGFQLSNGLAFSPDCSTLYFVDSAQRRIYAYDWNRADGSLHRRRVLVQVPMEEGFPDGLTVDADGFLWCAHWFGGCLIRYDPEGKEERRVPIPASQTSSVAFGGPELSDLFVTSAAHADSLQHAPTGFNPDGVFMGGPVYHLKPGFQGRQEYQARVTARW